MNSDETQDPIRRVESLAYRLFEQGLSQAELSELDQLIREFDGTAEAYARYADIHAMLDFVHGGVKSEVPEARDIDRDVFEEIIELAKQERQRAEVESQAEAMLRAERTAAREAHQPSAKDDAAPRGQRILVIPTWLVYAGGLGAAALIALAIYPLLKSVSPAPSSPTAQQQTPDAQPAPLPGPELAPQPQDEAVLPRPILPNATLARTYNTVWEGYQRPVQGEALGNRPYRLTEGFAELIFANGASVIVQAPAQLRVASASELELDRGLLKATVPPGAEGFTVQTPAGRVVDLGTEFGVEVHDNGQATLDVMTGKVRAELPEMRDSVELVAGQGTSLLQGSDQLLIETAQAELYPTDWSLIHTGLRTYDDGVQLFSLPASIEVGKYENNNRIVAFAERRGVRLEADLPVSIVRPGRYSRMPREDTLSISSGTVVDSYLLHFDAEGDAVNKLVFANASFKFDQPILGLIVTHRGLNSTDVLFAAELVQYPVGVANSRGLEGLEHDDGRREQDMLHLDSHRKTLTVRFGTTNVIDQVRVILQSEVTPES